MSASIAVASSHETRSKGAINLADIPDGSRKFGTFEVDTRPARPTVAFQLYVDGEEAWSLDVVGQPIHRPVPPASLGRNLAMSLGELLGFGSRRWF